MTKRTLLLLVGGAGVLAASVLIAESVSGVYYDKWSVHCFSGVSDGGAPYCMIDYRLSQSGWNIRSSEDDLTLTSYGKNPQTCRNIEITERFGRNWNAVHPPTDMAPAEERADQVIAALRSHLPLVGDCRPAPTSALSMRDALQGSKNGLRRAVINTEDDWLKKKMAERDASVNSSSKVQ